MSEFESERLTQAQLAGDLSVRFSCGYVADIRDRPESETNDHC